MTAKRQVEPEWLDLLPANDARAVRSRRDLIRINDWMLQSAIMARSLREHFYDQPPRTLIDIGSGDGTFILSVARKLAPDWQNVSVILVDRQDIVSPETLAAFRALRWNPQIVATDVFEFLEGYSKPCAVTANLFLHHFHDDELARLLKAVAHVAQFFVACEPWRASVPLLLGKMLWAIGCNDVSRHDALVSIRAGFTAQELSALWPEPARWNLQECRAWLFTHLFIANKIQ